MEVTTNPNALTTEPDNQSVNIMEPSTYTLLYWIIIASTIGCVIVICTVCICCIRRQKKSASHHASRPKKLENERGLFHIGAPKHKSSTFDKTVTSVGLAKVNSVDAEEMNINMNNTQNVIPIDQHQINPDPLNDTLQSDENAEFQKEESMSISIA